MTTTSPAAPATAGAKWLSAEFLGYYLILAQAFYLGGRSVLWISSRDHPNHRMFKGLLSEGWIPGRLMDLSDAQYGAFRRHLLPLAGLLAVFVVLNGRLGRSDPALSAALSLGFLFLLHGCNVVKIAAIVAVNFHIAQSAPVRLRPLLTWSWALLVLFLTEWASFPLFPESLFQGFYRRWTVVFKLTVLRMISFNMDYHWFDPSGGHRLLHRQSCRSCQGHDSGPEGASLGDECAKCRDSFGCRGPADFDWFSYLSYLFYPPLYLAGPIMTFNNFVAQRRQPITVRRRTLLYGVRVLGSLLLLDVLLHYVHVVAIKEAHAWAGYSPLEFGMLAYFNLKVIWLKLLVIWRFSRLFAMADAVEPPENMCRCMSNNYSGMAFWRSWHRSFYLWIVRYLYVPLGGSQAVLWNIWPVFTFVAVWHDLRLHLLAWSWLICLFFLPELLAGHLVARFSLTKHRFYNVLAGAGAATSIATMMLANLVGFAVGLDGLRVMLRGIVGVQGLFFLVVSFVTGYAAAQIMFEVRAEELRRGIDNKF